MDDNTTQTVVIGYAYLMLVKTSELKNSMK
jgi:hypothetical protein